MSSWRVFQRNTGIVSVACTCFSFHTHARAITHTHMRILWPASAVEYLNCLNPTWIPVRREREAMDEDCMSIPQFVLQQFESHARNLRKASEARREAVAPRNIVEDSKDREAISVTDTLGRKQPEDVYEGDVSLRTLRLLLKMIDERGWERCALTP